MGKLDINARGGVLQTNYIAGAIICFTLVDMLTELYFNTMS